MFENAVSYVTLSENLMNVDELKVLPQIKFISTFNNEILGEFHLSDSELSSLNKLKGSEAIKIKNSGFRLNRYPSLP
jgi:L-ribulose-5-phosphate 3-epimerase UlaE